MSGVLFALLACAIAGMGARDQTLVAGLAARNGAGPGLLAVALASSAIAAAVATVAALQIVPLLASDARRLVAALALALAGAEMVLLRVKPVGAEPTHSLGATFIVLLAQQVTDASRFLILALGIATGAPIAAGVGGAAAGAILVGLGWALGAEIDRWPLRRVRVVAGVVLLALSGWLALTR